MRHASWWILPGLCVLAGCVATEGSKGLPLVSGNPFGTPPPTVGVTKPPPGSSDAAFKVDYVGRKLIDANKQIGLRPYFYTAGVPTLEIFHVDTKAIYVTDGVVNRCKTEEDLAAVLARELGKMVAEREIKASVDFRERPLPINVPIGNDAQGGGADRTNVVELAKYEKENPRRFQTTKARPNPLALAGSYLDKAGYSRGQLETVRPLVEEAENNCTLERQVKGLPPKNAWVP